MNEEKLKYPEWQVPLQAVIRESNLDRLPAKIQTAETFIFNRLQRLHTSTGGAGEREAINDALDVLRTVKRERLDFPGWK